MVRDTQECDNGRQDIWEMNNYDQLMVDIETLGHKSYSAILSIAAVPFNWHGKTGKPFYVDINLQSCINAKLRMDTSTILWWLKQSEPARSKIYNSEGIPMKDALMSFRTFLIGNSFTGIWGNGSRFDLGIIDNACHAVGIDTPWQHWTERDVRTLVAFAPDIKKQIPFEGVQHSAVDDCLHQIKYCTAIWQKLQF